VSGSLENISWRANQQLLGAREIAQLAACEQNRIFLSCQDVSADFTACSRVESWVTVSVNCAKAALPFDAIASGLRCGRQILRPQFSQSPRAGWAGGAAMFSRFSPVILDESLSCRGKLGDALRIMAEVAG